MLGLIFSIAFASNINVMIVDTGISFKNKELLPYVTSFEEATHDHGPLVTSIVLSDQRDDWVCKKVKVTICHSGYDEEVNMYKYYSCLREAIKGGYDFVNLSLSGKQYSATEEALLRKLTKNTVVVVAAGNDKSEVSYAYPAAFAHKHWENLRVITNSKHPTSNYGKDTIDVDGVNILGVNMKNELITMSGTSMSAARYTHSLIKKRCKNDFYR